MSVLKKLTVFLAVCFSHYSLGAEEISLCHWKGDLRQKGLSQLEETMNWMIPFSSRNCHLQVGLRPKIWAQTLDPLREFELEHGYFSHFHPLVGMVTEDSSDVDILQKVFQDLMKSSDAAFIEIATEELLTKVLAYRSLSKEMQLSIPCVKEGSVFFIKYRVDEVLDLWQGMPAFGLIPLEESADPILLFRGTDFSLSSKRSWASVLSDLDFSGPGFSTFSCAKEKIHEWLIKTSLKGKAKVMGFSLGGSFAMYTTIFYREFVKSCVVFNAPGISKSVVKDWKEIGMDPPITMYATQGDFVSKLEQMIPKAFEMSDKTPMGVIEAHTTIMTARSPLMVFQIDVEKENKTRFLSR